MKVLKITFATILGIVGLVFALDFFSADQPDYAIREELFKSAMFGESRDDQGYCFGLDGGASSSYPCVFIWGDISSYEKENGDVCYTVQYLPEVNIGFEPQYLDPEQRRLLWPSDKWSVDVCGKFISTVTWFNGGDSPDDWYFVTEEFVSDQIRKQLIEQGYPI